MEVHQTTIRCYSARVSIFILEQCQLLLHSVLIFQFVLIIILKSFHEGGEEDFKQISLSMFFHVTY